MELHTGCRAIKALRKRGATVMTSIHLRGVANPCFKGNWLAGHFLGHGAARKKANSESGGAQSKMQRASVV